ncbi:MAG: four helix bundle protein, partial [Bacteroidota bacterium]
MVRSHFTNWLAFQKGELLADELFWASADFPKREIYSLTSQIRRSSRSVCSNLAEGYAK